MSKYWCNCIESAEAAGKNPGRTARFNGYDTSFHPVEVHKDGTCKHCGYTAFFSKENPNVEERAHV